MTKNPKKRPNTWAVFITYSIQMGVMLFLASRAGKWLDARYDSGKTFALLCVMVALFLSLYAFIKKLNKLN